MTQMASRRHLWAPFELDTKTFSEGERLSLYLRGQQKNHQIAFHAPILLCRPACDLQWQTMTAAHMCSASGVISPHGDKCYGTPKTCVCRRFIWRRYWLWPVLKQRFFLRGMRFRWDDEPVVPEAYIFSWGQQVSKQNWQFSARESVYSLIDPPLKAQKPGVFIQNTFCRLISGCTALRCSG